MLEGEKIKNIRKKWYEDLDTMDQIALWEDGAPGFERSFTGQRQPSIGILPVTGSTPRGAVIICAGGAYLCKSFYEGKPVAEYIHAAGLGAAVLDYRVKPYMPWDTLADAKRAIRIMRSKAPMWNIDPDKIAILGFSAGGHLAGMAGTLYDSGNPQAEDQTERVSSRPEAVVQCYGSISLVSVPGMEGLLDIGQKGNKLVAFSPDMNIKPDSPPFFLWQTGDDEIVSTAHILNMAGALSNHAVPYELHIFPHGPHGLGLADGKYEGTPRSIHTAQWIDLMIKWLKTLGF